MCSSTASSRASSRFTEALQQWLDHRRDVLLRRSRHRLAEIVRRLEVLAGMLIVFLNLDEVIRIIREEDEPKPRLKDDLRAHRQRRPITSSTRACAPCAGWRKCRSQREHDELVKEKRRDRGAARRRGPAVEDDHLADPRDQEEIRAGDEARQRRTTFDEAPRARRRRSRRRVRRARAGHRRRLAKGLDPRAERPGRRS